MVSNRIKIGGGGGSPGWEPRLVRTIEANIQRLRLLGVKSNSEVAFGASGSSLCHLQIKVVIPAFTRGGLAAVRGEAPGGVGGGGAGWRAATQLWFLCEATQADPPERPLAGGRSERSDKQRVPPPRAHPGPHLAVPQAPAGTGSFCVCAPVPGRSGAPGPSRGLGGQTEKPGMTGVPLSPRGHTDFCGRDQLEAM